jgi:hypothetical protein
VFRRGVVGLGGIWLRALEFPFGSADEGWVSEGEVSIGLPGSAMVGGSKDLT